MPTHKPTYFLTPPRPYPPSGPMRLAAIIPSPTQPDEPLHLPPLPSLSDISTFTERNWSGSYVKQSSSRFGIWTSFLEMVTSIGGDVSVNIDRALKHSWEVESMMTMSFHPSKAFLEEAVQHKEVKDYVMATLFREKIYMITGVMIAEFTTSFRESLEEKGLHIHAGVDATAWTGVPIAVGPEGKWKRKEMVVETSRRDEEFVFAYRVREIKVRRAGRLKADRVYDKGALFNTEKKIMVQQEVDMELVGLDDEVEGDEFGLEAREVTQAVGEDGKEDCICVLPEPQ